jgi:rod shape-determining protein MreD
MKENILIILIYLPVLLLQLLADRFLTFNYVGPDIILIYTVFITLNKGQLYGSVIGFVFGLIYDLFSGGLIGVSMFSLTLGGFTAGFFFNENKKNYYFNSYMFVLIVFLCAWISSFFHSVFESSKLPINMFVLIIEYGLIPGIYTAALSVPVIIFYPKTSLE